MKTVKIFPKCNQPYNNMNICLRHDGYVVPCCFLADIGQPWNELKKLLGDKLSQIHIKNNNIDNINKSEAYRMIYESFTNNPMKKELNLELSLEDIGKKIKTNLNYFNNPIIGELDLSSGSTNYLTKLEFDDNKIYLYSEKKINQDHLYLADIDLNPFYANLVVNLNSIDFFDLIKKEKKIFLPKSQKKLGEKINLENKIEYVSLTQKPKNLFFSIDYNQENLALALAILSPYFEVTSKAIESIQPTEAKGHLGYEP